MSKKQRRESLQSFAPIGQAVKKAEAEALEDAPLIRLDRAVIVAGLIAGVAVGSCIVWGLHNVTRKAHGAEFPPVQILDETHKGDKEPCLPGTASPACPGWGGGSGNSVHPKASKPVLPRPKPLDKAAPQFHPQRESRA
jgi:hypothetical protein